MSPAGGGDSNGPSESFYAAGLKSQEEPCSL